MSGNENEIFFCFSIRCEKIAISYCVFYFSFKQSALFLVLLIQTHIQYTYMRLLPLLVLKWRESFVAATGKNDRLCTAKHSTHHTVQLFKIQKNWERIVLFSLFVAQFFAPKRRQDQTLPVLMSVMVFKQRMYKICDYLFESTLRHI